MRPTRPADVIGFDAMPFLPAPIGGFVAGFIFSRGVDR